VREYLWGQLLGERRLVSPEDLARAIQERDACLQRGQATTIVGVLVQHRRLDAALMPALARELEARGRACNGCRRAYLAAGPEPAPRCPTCGGPAGLSAAAPSPATSTPSGRFTTVPQPPPPRSASASGPMAAVKLTPPPTRASGPMPAVTLTPRPPSAAQPPTPLPASTGTTPPSSAGPPPTAPGSSLSATAPDGQPPPAEGITLGRRFGPYEILRELGRGGMGVVYQVRRPDAPGPLLALKVLIAGEFASPRLLERFRDEARLAAGLRHPHIVAVHDSGDVDGIPYYAMDFVEGSDLQHLIKGDNLTTRRGVELLAQAARAVHHAHEKGIVHRDLKPSNILVSSAGAAYLMDFGLAKNLDDDKGLTRSGVAIGTPFYMPPEQALGQHRELDARADVYALGAILYEVLARKVPFNAPTQAALTRLILEAEPTPPGQVRAGVPPQLETVCLKALRKAKEDRYPSAAAMADDLEGWLAGQGVEATREAPWKPLLRQLKRHRVPALAAGVVLLALAAMWTYHRSTVDALEATAAEREEARRRAEEEARRLAAAGAQPVVEEEEAPPPEPAAAGSSAAVTRVIEARQAQDPAEAQRLLAEAERLLTEALGATPPAPDVLYQRALVRRGLARWADARADFAAAAAGPGVRARAHLGRALIDLRWARDAAQAQAALREAAPSALPPATGDGRDEETTADLVARAYLDHLRGEHDAAQRRLDELRAATKNAMLAEVHGALAYLARQQGAALGGDPHAEHGRAAADEALRADRWRSSFTVVDRGLLRARAGDVNGALEDLRVSRLLDPDSEQPDLVEAVIAARRGEAARVDEALAAAAAKAARRSPAIVADVAAFGAALTAARQRAELTERVTALVAGGRFREASEALEAVAKADPDSKALTELRRAIDGPAQLKVEEALAALERTPGPASQQALDELLARVPPSVVAAVTPRLEAAARARAGRDAGAVYARRDQALRAGDRAAALAAVDAGLADPALAPARDELARAKADLQDVTRAWDAFDASCRALADDLAGRLRLRGASAPLRGRLLDYDPVKLSARHEAPGRREPSPLDLRDVNPADLAALALPPAEGRANALFFLGRGLPEAARAALDAGGVTDAALRAEVERAAAAALEARVAATLDQALAPGVAAEALVAAAAGLDAATVATAAYRERHERLKEAWTAARAAQLEAAPEGLFRGALTASRRGAIKLRYTFARPEELLDWAPDLTLDPSSGGRPGEDGGVIVRGKVAHVAQWQPGELTVELKATTTNPRQPNINVIFGDRGGWTGALLGNGFMQGTLTALLVDPTVPRRPTQAIPLPADVILALDGREPSTSGPNLFVAPTAASSGSRKVEASRDEEGALRLKVKGKDVARAAGSPGGNAVGAVAFASFATEVLVQEVELVGRLDAAWVAARARTVAAAEAQALPAPR
jgi:hypothetical protein